MSSAEHPERALAHEQVDAGVLRARVGEGREPRDTANGLRAQRVEGRERLRGVATAQGRLGFDQSRFDAGEQRDRSELREVRGLEEQRLGVEGEAS